MIPHAVFFIFLTPFCRRTATVRGRTAGPFLRRPPHTMMKPPQAMPASAAKRRGAGSRAPIQGLRRKGQTTRIRKTECLSPAVRPHPSGQQRHRAVSVSRRMMREAGRSCSLIPRTSPRFAPLHHRVYALRFHDRCIPGAEHGAGRAFGVFTLPGCGRSGSWIGTVKTESARLSPSSGISAWRRPTCTAGSSRASPMRRQYGRRIPKQSQNGRDPDVRSRPFLFALHRHQPVGLERAAAGRRWNQI